jgi:tetratricopeptide (TPR) repeat protein
MTLIAHLPPDFLPPAVAAVAEYPHLYHQTGRALEAQTQRIAERCALFVPRPAAAATLEQTVRDCDGGFVALDCDHGGGATALICWLAATRRWAFWLPEDDAGGGLAALCAQILALADLPVPLVPPIASRDALTLERLLAEAAEKRQPDNPLVVVIGRAPDNAGAPVAPPLPACLPPGVVVVMLTTPDTQQPAIGAHFAARASLRADEAWLADIAAHLSGNRRLATVLALRSQGSLLYLRLAIGLLAGRALDVKHLPDGLTDLHQRWWEGLDAHGRALARILAAACEPLPVSLAATLAGCAEETIRWLVQRWGPLIERTRAGIRLYHRATRAFIAAMSDDSLASAHAQFVELTLAQSNGAPERPGWQDELALSREFARHSVLGGVATQVAISSVVRRAWVRAQERRSGNLSDAAVDGLWALRAAAADNSALQLVRAAALTGGLTFLARSLPPHAPAEVFAAAIDRGQPRDATMKRIRAMIDQLPDGRDKALALRNLGEVCYALRMRAPAMRMLSEALDLEAPGPTRQWRDQHEETLVALARAAIGIGAPDTALGITTRIVHTERRGMIETEVVRWLIAHRRLSRAEEVAYAIAHPGNHDWAMAEVAIAHARAGDYERAGLVLDTLRAATTVAWVTVELACDAARRGNPRAADRVMLLPNPTLRDRALAQVARALIVQVAPETALEVARMIDDHEIRARCLIDMAIDHPPVAAQALDEAATAAIAVEGEERASVIAALAAAEAASGQFEVGVRMAALLPEGEERDRAHSRIAIALARRGNYVTAETVALTIADDDERSWALDELARVLAANGRHREAFALATQIGDDTARARLEADLAIAWARSGAAVAAHARAEQISVPTERARAQAAITQPLVETGARARAFASIADVLPPDERSRYLLAAAQALAAHGLPDDAEEVARLIPRPFERTRALVATAHSVVKRRDVQRAHRLLGQAFLTIAPLGRAETLQCIGWAADALALIGGAELLLTAAAALDEIDSWLVG